MKVSIRLFFTTLSSLLNCSGFFLINKKREKGKRKKAFVFISRLEDISQVLSSIPAPFITINNQHVQIKEKVQFVRQHVPIKEIVQLGRQHVQIIEMVQFVDPHVQIKEMQEYKIGSIIGSNCSFEL